MPTRQATTKASNHDQDVRRSRRLRQAVIPTSTPSSPRMISGSPTPVWSGGESPAHLHNDDAVKPQEEQNEEDKFMPTTQEVAETLARMKLRHENCDMGNEVSCIQLEYGAQIYVVDIRQVPSTQTQPTKGTPGQILLHPWPHLAQLSMCTHYCSYSPGLPPFCHPNPRGEKSHRDLSD